MNLPPISPQETTNYLDIAFKVATISIAIFNAIFAIKIFNLKTEQDKIDKNRDRKIQLLKTLILDHNFKNFYSIFDEIEDELIKLKETNLSDDKKSIIDSNLSELFIKLRRKFYDSLLAIETPLYDEIKKQSDELQSHFSLTIFDPGINLSHIPKYDDLINEKLINTKTAIIKELFGYRGGDS
jgi:hypothetical protein